MDSPTPSLHHPRRRRPNVSKSHAHHPEERVRLMCSYGGRIVPRPHDKCLCYVGGDTRIIVVHRHSSLRELCLLLSGTLLHGRPFILKYLLPGQDLDSLISIIHDEDLQLMIQEYDRVITSSSPLKPLRLRLFLFFCDQLETANPIRSPDAKQETRFVDAINDSRILSRLVSDASAVDRSAKPGGTPLNEYNHNLGALSVIQNNKKIKSLADVADTSPSGSVSSSPSMFSLPSLGDYDNGNRLKQQRCQMEELNFGTTDGCAVSSADLVPPVMVTTGYNMDGVTCDALASELTPSPLQLVRARASDALSLLSPNSVTSENRIASSCIYLSQPVHLQEQANMRSEISDANPAIQRDKVEESRYRLATQVDQNQEMVQFVRCVQQVEIPCSYPVYAILPVVATHPTGASSGKPLLTPQIGTASTVYNNGTSIVNAASNPAFLQPAQFHQHYYVDFPQFHYCPLQSTIAFAPSPHDFEHQSTANVQKQTNTSLPPQINS
ncbi:hypothetical protein K1719_015272 [Acacia pycnantha]|nr:hypothetical protein K1719_015272 [Acacia pycnantha]